MQRGELACWMALALSGFGLLFPHLAAGAVQDPGPLRLMALAVFILSGLILADQYLLGSALFRSIARL